MSFKYLLQSSTVRFCLLALMLCGITLTGSQATGLASAAALPVAVEAEMQDAQLLETSPSNVNATIRIQCLPDAVTMNAVQSMYVVSIHSVNCSENSNGIIYWTFSGDAQRANQILAIALTAQTRNHVVNIFYDPADTNVPDPAIERNLLAIGVDR